jgi:tyrosine-protein phosphatase SIW14
LNLTVFANSGMEATRETKSLAQASTLHMALSIRPLCLTCALVSALSLSPIVGIAAEKSSTATATASESKTPSIDIDNFGRINDTFYRGSQPDGQDYTDLATLGVKTVIDLQADGLATERQLVESAGMRFFRIPMTTRKVPTSDDLSRFLQLVNDPANQPVYVHCAGGRHRTGVMTAVYRMTHDGWNSDQAFKEMKQYDFGADFLHPEFKRFVYSYRVEPDLALPAPTVVGAPATVAGAANATH